MSKKINYQNKYKRALADYQNLEKRISAEKTAFLDFASAALISKLLPILDDLERAVNHNQDKGLQMILDQFLKVLASEGVKPIPAKNKKFNPLTMEAIEQVNGKPKNTVVDVITVGYYLKDKVLRTAKVRVGK